MQWTGGALDRRASILIQRLSVSHVTCDFKNHVELSPTWEKLKKRVWFIRCDELEG